MIGNLVSSDAATEQQAAKHKTTTCSNFISNAVDSCAPAPRILPNRGVIK
jgi:hypothetical protein